MQKKMLFFVAAILCLAVAGWGYYLYQKPRAGVADASAAYTLAATELYQAFVSNEAAANAKYVDQVLKVRGTVQQIDSLQGTVNLIMAAGAEGGVSCSIAPGKPLPRVGEQVTVKGRCTGFLMDVSLVDAVLERK